VNSDNLFEIAFNSASEGLLVVDKSGEIVLVNERMSYLFGYEKSEMLNQRIEMFVPRKSREKHVALRDGFIHDPHSRPMGLGAAGLKGQRKDGSVFPVEVSLNHFTQNGERYVLGLITDISEREKIESELRAAQNKLFKLNEELEMLVIQRTAELEKSQQLYEMIAKNFPDGVINVLDDKLNYIFAEGKELARFGIGSQDLIGNNYLERIQDPYRSEIGHHLNLALSGENQTCIITFNKNLYELNIVGIEGVNGLIDRLLIVENNVTKQKELELEQARALEREKELGQMKSRFVSMASHEFRTPLSAILSSASLIEKYEEKDQQPNRQKHTSRIKSSVSNLTGILNDFLSFDKLSSNLVECEISEVNVCNVLNYAIEEVSSLKKKTQEIVIEIDESKCIFNTDEKILKNILLNLLSNGLKYSKEDGEVEVNLEISEGILSIKVSDSGIGIPKSDQVRLFERFFRAENVSNIQGTGLGLNIVKKYTEILGGSISFTSVENEGTTFEVKIPEGEISI